MCQVGSAHLYYLWRLYFIQKHDKHYGYRLNSKSLNIGHGPSFQMLQAAESCALPDGVFFNGSKYVNWDGETLKEHPCLPQVIDDFLEKERLGDALCPLPAPTASILCLFHSPLLLRFEASLGSASCVTPGLFCRARCAALAHG